MLTNCYTNGAVIVRGARKVETSRALIRPDGSRCTSPWRPARSRASSAIKGHHPEPSTGSEERRFVRKRPALASTRRCRMPASVDYKPRQRHAGSVGVAWSASHLPTTAHAHARPSGLS